MAENDFESEQKSEEYITNESAEISIGERPYLIGKLTDLFPALQSRNYQLYFVGQLVSMIGTWLQIVAQGWLVLKLTNSAFQIGLVAALSSLPTLFFALFGGAIVDRLPKRKILIFTQTASMVLAFVLGFLTVTGSINVPIIALLAFLLGVVSALDMPARQAFVVEMVTKRDQLPSAIALNAGVFNGARVIGPSIAGILIATIGTGGAFIANGVSYLAVIVALFLMKVVEVKSNVNIHPLKAISMGISYSFGHSQIRMLLFFTAVVSIFGWSFMTVMPLIAQNTFHLGADGLGFLFAASGLGALLATFAVSAFSKRIGDWTFIIGGNTLFAVPLILFTFTNNLPLALFLLFVSGFGLLAQFSVINSALQHLVTNEFRGRVMSIYTLMFLGLFPVGNFEIGFLSEHFGTEVAIRFSAIITLIFGILVFAYRKRGRES